MTEQLKPNLIEELQVVTKNLWNHMQWDLIEDDKIYPIKGHQEDLVKGFEKYNDLISTLGESAPEGIRDTKLVIWNGQVRQLPKDQEVK